MGRENEHEKWDPIDSIAVESESFVRTQSEKREVKYNFYFNTLFLEAECKRVAIFMQRKGRDREL
jgi:hypothetical protein